MLNLAPWNYRNLLKENEIIEDFQTYKFETLLNVTLNEVLVKLNQKYIPSWANKSIIYSSADGSGTSPFMHIALYKAISEALERWAFYETIENKPKGYSFDVDPSTNGMAAYPDFTATNARKKAILEATERWALLEFWRGKLPIKSHKTSIKILKHYEILTPLKDNYVSLLSFEEDGQFFYSFACEATLQKSFAHAMTELSRNIRVLKKFKKMNKTYLDLLDINDKRLAFFSEKEGYELFLQKIKNSPLQINSTPEIICDSEIKGQWTNYARVWRFLYRDSFPDHDSDHTCFMF